MSIEPSLIVSVLALAVAAVSYYEAKKANEIAEKSLRVSHRPYVDVEPIPLEGEARLFMLTRVSETKSVLSLRFRLINVGRTEAKNLSYIVTKLRIQNEGGHFELPPGDPVKNEPSAIRPIAPSREAFTTPTQDIFGPKESMAYVMREYEKGLLQIIVGIRVDYESSVEPGRQHTTEYTFTMTGTQLKALVDCHQLD